MGRRSCELRQIVEANFMGLQSLALDYRKALRLLEELMQKKENNQTESRQTKMEAMSMRVIPISMVAISVVVGGCSAETNTRVAGDLPIWGRADCQRGEGNPELQADFDKAKATCLARGESAAAVAGNGGNSPCMSSLSLPGSLMACAI